MTGGPGEEAQPGNHDGVAAVQAWGRRRVEDSKAPHLCLAHVRPRPGQPRRDADASTAGARVAGQRDADATTAGARVAAGGRARMQAEASASACERPAAGACERRRTHSSKPPHGPVQSRHSARSLAAARVTVELPHQQPVHAIQVGLTRGRPLARGRRRAHIKIALNGIARFCPAPLFHPLYVSTLVLLLLM